MSVFVHKHFKSIFCTLTIFLASCLSLVVLTSSAHATSYEITFDSNSDFSTDVLVYQDSNATMAGTPLLNFAPVYVEIEQHTTGYSSSMYRYCGPNGYGILTNAQGSGYNLNAVDCINTLTSFSSFNLTDWWSYHSHNYILLIRPSQFSALANYSDNYIKYTFYDSLPSSDCPDCPDCPVVPTESELLDKIYHAILIIPAFAFVMYIFYIVYGWYLGGKR